MKFKTEVTILGARKFNDVVDGTKYDFTKVRVQMPVPENAENEVGFSEVTMTFGTHENFEKLRNLQFPLTTTVELTATSKGYDFNGIVNAPSVKAAA